MQTPEPLPAGRPGPRDLFAGALVFAGATLLVALIAALSGGVIPGYFAYLAPVAAIAYLGGLPAGAAATVIGGATADYLFVEPKFSLHVAGSPVPLVLFALAGIAASAAAARIRRGFIERARYAEGERAAQAVIARRVAERALAGQVAAFVAHQQPPYEVAAWLTEQAGRLFEGFAGVFLSVSGSLSLEAAYHADHDRLAAIGERLGAADALPSGDANVLGAEELAALPGGSAELGSLARVLIRTGEVSLGSLVVATDAGEPPLTAEALPLLQELADLLAASLESARRARAEEDARAASERSRADAEYALAVAGALEPAGGEAEVLEALARASAGVLGDVVTVWRTSGDGVPEPAVAFQHDPQRGRPVAARSPGREGEQIAARAVRERKVVVLDGDAQERPRSTLLTRQAAGRRAVVAVPALSGGWCAGVLVGTFAASPPRAPQVLARLAEIAAAQAGLAISRIRLERAERARSARLDAVRETLAAAPEGAEALIQTFFEAVRSHGVADAGGAWRAAGPEGLEALATFGRSDEPLTPGRETLAQLAIRAAEHGAIAIVTEPSRYERRPGLCAAVAVPWKMDDGSSGAIALGSQDPQAYGEGDAIWIGPVAEGVALALRAADLREAERQARDVETASRADADAARDAERAAKAAEAEARAAEQAAKEAAALQRTRAMALQRAISAVAGADDLEAAMVALLAEAVASSGAAGGAVALPDSGGLRLVAAMGTLADSPRRILPPGEAGVLGEAFKKGAAVWTDAANVPHAMATGDGDMRAVALPLPGDGTVAGVVGLSFTEGYQMSPDTHGFLRALADHGAIAIESARLRDETREASADAEHLRADLATLATATARISLARTEGEIADAVIAALSERVGAAALYRVRDRAPEAVLIGAAGWPQRVADRIGRVPLAWPAGGPEPAMAEPALLQEVGDALGLHHRLVTPLRFDGQTVGVLISATGGDAGVRDRLTDLVGRLAGTIAGALARAEGTERIERLHEEAVRERAERDRLIQAERDALDATAREQEWNVHLEEAVADLDAAGTDAEIVAALLHHSVSAVGARAGAVALRTGRGGALELVRAVGYPEDALDAWGRMPITAPVPLAEAARRGQVIVAAPRTDEGEPYPLPEPAERPTAGLIVAVPLSAGGRTLGATELLLDGATGLAEAERKHLSALGSLAAQAMDRLRLAHAEARRSAALGAISRVAAAAHSGAEPEPLLEALAEAARDAAGAAHAVAFWSGGAAEPRWVARGAGLDALQTPDLLGMWRDVSGLASPVRLDDVHRHPFGDAIPAGYPPAAAYLGVAIRSRNDEGLGGIVITDPAPARFGPEVEQSLVAMAHIAASGLAENADAAADPSGNGKPVAISVSPEELAPHPGGE